MIALRKSQSSRSKMSSARRNLIAATIEGVPANVMMALLNAPFLTGYLLLLGANSFQIGLVLALPTLLNLIQIPAAFWMQKYPNRKLGIFIFAGMHRIFWALTGTVPFLVGERYYFAVYFAFYLLAFIGNSIGSVIWTSLIADMVPAAVRGKYFGIRNTILCGVSSLTLFLGGYVLQLVPGMRGYHILFIAAGIAAVLNIITFSLYPNLPMEKSPAPGLRGMIRKPFENRMFARAIAFITAWQFLQTLVVPLFSYIMLSVMGFGEFFVSVLTIVQTVSMMVSFYVWGRLNARIPTRRLLLWSFPLIAGSCVLWSGTLIVPAAAVLVVIHILLGAGLGGNQLMLFNFLIGDTPKSERPMYVAVFSGITGIASFLGPTAGGYLFKLIGNAPEWIQATGLTTAAGLLLLLLAGLWGPYIFADKSRKRTGT